LKGHPATKAAAAAGYSPRTARPIGQRLLTNVVIAAAIEKAQKKALDDAQMTAEHVLHEYAVIAFLDPGY
jgi:phage terminase small subunit